MGMLTRPKLMLPFQIARAIQRYFASRVQIACSVVVTSSEGETSLTLGFARGARNAWRDHRLRALISDSVAFTVFSGFTVASYTSTVSCAENSAPYSNFILKQRVRVLAEKCRAIRKDGSKFLRSSC